MKLSFVRAAAVILAAVLCVASLAVLPVSIPASAEEILPAPTFLYDFSTGLTDDIATQQICMTYENADGYITFHATGDDPYFRFADGYEPKGKTDQLAYAVIKYRTTAEIASGEFFTNRHSGPQWGAPGTHVTWSYIPDGSWHVVIADASNVWGDSPYDSLYAFRLDPLASGAKAGDSIDIAFIAFFSTYADAVDYAVGVLPEDADNIIPKPEHTIKYMVDGKVIYTRTYREGDTAVADEPKVPTRPGCIGAWEAYTLGTTDLTVNAVYTPKSQETVPPMPETDPETQALSTDPSTDDTTIGSSTDPADDTATGPDTDASSIPTDADTQAPDGTATDTASATDEKGGSLTVGCSSSLALSALTLIPAAMIAVTLRKKREE